MNKNIFLKKQGFALLFGLLILSFSSCSLDEVAYDKTSPESVGDSDIAATTWVMGVYNGYSQMFQYNEFPSVFEYDADYLSGHDWAFGKLGAGNFQGTQIDKIWEYCYKVIHRGNEALFYIEQMKNVTPRYKENVIAEIKFLQAFSYFWMVRCYGEIPIYKKAITQGNSYNEPRQTIPVVYEHIIELLKEGKDKMYKNTDSEFQEGRASAGAAASLLAKVYATIGSASLPSGQVVIRGGKPFNIVNDVQVRTMPQRITLEKNQVKGYETFNSNDYYTLARDMAKDVMDKKYGNYGLLPFDNLWKLGYKNKTEHIWSLQAVSGDIEFGTYLSRDFSGMVENGLIIQGLFHGLRDHWYKMFDKNDRRIIDGVKHRFVRDFDYNNIAAHFGSYYPNDDEYTLKAQGKRDPNTGELIVKPVAPYDDGINYTCGTSAYYLAYLTKYDDVSDRTKERGDANFPFLRYADVLLIYAEASNEVNNGPTTEGLQALNDVRTRSNAPEKKLTGEGNVGNVVEFRSAVIEERAMELALEADRRFDLIRWGIYLQTMNAIEGLDEVGVNKERTERNILYPLPTSEILSNTAITQNNPGWN